nr:3155_t:CDS:2 [Entrophospora candida]
MGKYNNNNNDNNNEQEEQNFPEINLSFYEEDSNNNNNNNTDEEEVEVEVDNKPRDYSNDSFAKFSQEIITSSQATPRLSFPVRNRRRPNNLSIEPLSLNNDLEEVEEEITDQTVSLISKSQLDLSLSLSNISAISRVSLDLAGILTRFALETCKISTKAGLGIARAMTTVMSNRILQAATRDGQLSVYFLPRIIDATTTLLHRTLSLTEQVTLAGLDKTSTTLQYALGTATESISIIYALFGTTDAAKALAEFVQLVKREWNANDDDHLEKLETFGAFRVIKSLTAWACLQYITNEKYENELCGWKRVKLVDLWDICNGWVEISHDDTIYEDLEWLMVDDEEEEMVVITSNKSSKIVVGELTPRDEIPEFSFSMNDERTKRLSNLFLETTKRYSNPYLDEYENQTEEEKLFSVLHNLKRYSKFSSSAYDFKTAIIGNFPLLKRRYTGKGTLHRFTFARSSELPLDSIVDTSHQKNSTVNSSMYQPTYFLIRDHTTQSIILALRGTMSIHDLIVDLTCEYEKFQLPEDIQKGDNTIHYVHKGMFQVAKSLVKPGKVGVFEALKRELQQNDGYGLVLVGHSLGAGVASLLTLLLASPTTRMTTRWSGLPLGRRVHCYVFATPCVMSIDLSKKAKTLVTSVAYGNDVVCRLSLGHVKDLRGVVRYLGSANASTTPKTPSPSKVEADQEVIPEENHELASKVFRKFLDYKSRTFSENDEKSMVIKREFEQFFWNVREEIRSHMKNVKLYPPGKVYWIIDSKRAPYCNASEEIVSDGPDEEIFFEKNGLYNMLEINNVENIFDEIWFTPQMMTDHLPHVYENVLKKL